MFQQYIVTVSLVVLITVLTIARWGSPNNDLVTFTEYQKIQKVMSGKAKQECLGQPLDGEVTSNIKLLNFEEQLSVVHFINSGLLDPVDLGFAETQLPLTDSAENRVSRNTFIEWRFAGWLGGKAIVDASSTDAGALAVLRLINPNNEALSDIKLRLIMAGQTKRSGPDHFTYMKEEFFYLDTHPSVGFSGYSIDKMGCLL